VNTWLNAIRIQFLQLFSNLGKSLPIPTSDCPFQISRDMLLYILSCQVASVARGPQEHKLIFSCRSGHCEIIVEMGDWLESETVIRVTSNEKIAIGDGIGYTYHIESGTVKERLICE
jgi:hypothetical protein